MYAKYHVSNPPPRPLRTRVLKLNPVALPKGFHLPQETSGTYYMTGLKVMLEWDPNIRQWDQYRKQIFPREPYKVSILIAGPSNTGKLALVNKCLGRRFACKNILREHSKTLWTVLNPSRWHPRIDEVSAEFKFLSCSYKRRLIMATCSQITT
jgi:hypothetical protein